MATRLDGNATQTHIFPAYMVEVETMDTGGLWQVPDSRLGRAVFPGTAKVARAQDAYLRQMHANSALNRLVQFAGPVTLYEAVLSEEEAALIGIKLWIIRDRLGPLLRSAAHLALYNFGPRVVVRVAVPSELATAIQLGILKASQERTDAGAIGSTPVHTRIDHLYDKMGVCQPFQGSSATLMVHKTAIHLITALMAEGRACAVDSIGGVFKHLPDQDPVDEGEDEAAESNVTGMVIPCRESEAEERTLRPSVVVEDKTEELKQHELEKGIRKPDEMPDADHVPVKIMTENIAPAVAECAAPMNPRSKNNELKGVSRHLADGTRHPYTDKAKVRFGIALEVARTAICEEFGRKELFKSCKLPAAWSESLKEQAAESAPFERMYKLSGFVKSGEIGLEVTKRPRLIGNPGPFEAEPFAEFISVFEQYFCYCFPSFMCKGKTLQQLDKAFEALLKDNQRLNRRIASCDFAAMDSSWYPHEKVAIRELIMEMARNLVDIIDAQAKPVDPTEFDKVRWVLKELTVNIDLVDMILFSGERGTSIFNRLLVLLMRTSELIRCRGTEAARNFWAHNRRWCPRSEGDCDLGDGDDTAFDAQDYKDAEEIIQAYKAYGKTIEPVISSTAIEVLSRYCFLSAKGKFYALVKPKKNVQRCCYARRSTTIEEDGQVARPVAPSERAEFATAAYQRAIAAAQTPVVRHFALAVGDYQRAKAEEAGSKMTCYDRDLLRRRPELALEKQSLADLASVAHDAVSNAHANGFVMEHWAHFPYGTKTRPPNGKGMEIRAVEWMEADAAMKEVVISDDDMLHPSAFLERCGMTQHIASVLGVSPKLLTCCSPGAVLPTVARPVRDAGEGKTGLAPKEGGGDSESRPSAAAKQKAHPRRETGKSSSSGQTGRSRTTTVAGRGNTDGVAAVQKE